MPVVTYPKSPPFRTGCAECPIAQCNTIWGPTELNVPLPLDRIWSCRELGNKIVQDFSLCPIVDIEFFQRIELFDKYNWTQGEN